jgi:hypothetical protein
VIFIIGFIITLLLAFPQLDDALSWYKERLDMLKPFFQSLLDITIEEIYVYTIKETTYLRVEANAKSMKILTLAYDTRLRVLSSETPRWFEVEYIDENEDVFTGWVSKTSVQIAKE